jgi:putative membrane protein
MNRVTCLGSAAVAALLPVSTPALAQSGDWRGFGFFDDWGWGHMAFGGATMLLFWGGLIFLVVLIVRTLGGLGASREATPPRQTALEVLQERYARGEIDKQEFEEKKRDLSS